MDITPFARELRNIIRDCNSILGPNHTIDFNGNEADSASVCLQQLSISHATGVYVLAFKNTNLAYPAFACARAAFKAGMLAAWLSIPDIPSERLSRWIGHWRTIGRFYNKQGEILEASTPGISKTLSDVITGREEMYTRLMKSDPKLISQKPPSVKKLLDEIGHPHCYAAYCEACEIVHSGPEAVIRARHGNRTEKHSLGYSCACTIHPADWAIPLKMSAWAPAVATYHALRRHGIKKPQLKLLIEKHSRFDRLIKEKLKY